MSYPNIEGKHAFRIVYSPTDALNYRRTIDSRENVIPAENVIFTYQPFAVSHMLSFQDGRRSHFVQEGEMYPFGEKTGFFLLNLGSAQAAVKMEELIAKGSKNFLNIGVAGSLQKNLQAGDIVICTKAIRDEGVSHHYLEPGKYVDLSSDLTRKLRAALSKQGLSFFEGPTWTIDAPFRETEEEIKQYQSEGILSVEMETAALAAIAKYRGVELATAFVISDSLADGVWIPRFHCQEVSEALKKLHEVSLFLFNG